MSFQKNEPIDQLKNDMQSKPINTVQHQAITTSVTQKSLPKRAMNTNHPSTSSALNYHDYKNKILDSDSESEDDGIGLGKQSLGTSGKSLSRYFQEFTQLNLLGV
jgi:hypothetical protein